LALSEKTKTVLQRSLIRDKDDLYPDRAATSVNGAFPVKDTGSTYRHGDEVPTTTKDVSAMFKWEHGDELYGTHANEYEPLKTYRKDINRAYGKESQYKDVYIDTLSTTKLVSKQLEEL